MLKMSLVYPVKRDEVALHVREKNSDVDQIFPTGTGGLQNGANVGQNTVGLRFEIERSKVAIVVLRESWNPLIVGTAAWDSRANATQKQQVAYAAGQGVQPNRLWGRGVVAHGVGFKGGWGKGG